MKTLGDALGDQAHGHAALDEFFHQADMTDLKLHPTLHTRCRERLIGLPARTGPFGKVHQHLVRERCQGQLPTICQRMIRMQYRHQGLTGQQTMLHALQRLALPQADEADIQAPLIDIGHQPFALGGQPADVHVWVALVKHRQQINQIERRERTDFTDRQASSHLAAGRRDVSGMRSAASTAGRALRTKASPAGVSRTRRELRSNRFTPSCASSRAT